MSKPKLTDKQLRDIAWRSLGKKTTGRGATIESAVVVNGLIEITFEGTGLAPFRSARYTGKEVLQMIGEA